MNSLKRQTVLASAGATLARNPAASVADIASRAGVGRATLYRFFATREALIRALALESLMQIDEATQTIPYETMPAERGLAETFKAIVPLGDRFHFLANEPAVVHDPEFKAVSERQRKDLADLIDAMKSEGSLDRTVSTAWAVATVEALIYVAWASVDDGSVARRDAAGLAFRTFVRGLQPDQWETPSSRETKPAKS
ncbi:MAG: TetR/AcrR family transcriptional regulator [Pseudomonadota bacterium]